MKKRKYDTTRPTVQPGVYLPRPDWERMKKLANGKSILARLALLQAVQDWNEKNKEA